MKANELKGEELYNEVIGLYRSTLRRIERIRPTEYRLKNDAVSVWDKMEKNMTKHPSEMNDNELRTLYRDLNYINSLKTSTIEGASEAHAMFSDIEMIINSLSPEVKEKFWDVYRRLYDENTNIGQLMYKYDVLREIATVVEKASNQEQNLENIENTLMKVIELITGDNYINIHDEVMKHTLTLEGRFASANELKNVLSDLPNLDDTTSEDEIDTSKYGWWL